MCLDKKKNQRNTKNADIRLSFVPALLYYINCSVENNDCGGKKGKKKIISCGNNHVNKANHFTWRQTPCNHYSVCTVVCSKEQWRDGKQTHHISSCAELKSKYQHVSPIDQMEMIYLRENSLS